MASEMLSGGPQVLYETSGVCPHCGWSETMHYRKLVPLGGGDAMFVSECPEQANTSAVIPQQAPAPPSLSQSVLQRKREASAKALRETVLRNRRGGSRRP